MPDFQGNDSIIVQPGTLDYPYEFEFTFCSAAGANDGFFPFGRTMADVEVDAFKHDADNTEDTDLVADYTLNGSIVKVYLSYPTTNGAGRYKLRFTVTLDDDSEEEVDFGRVIVKDR